MAVAWTERKVMVGEHPIFVRVGPEVPGTVPIVHVHGFGTSGAQLLPTAELLAGTRTNLVPDLPGHGRSDEWGTDLDIPSIARGLLGLLDALELERVVLLGNSMGCPVSLEVAHEAPDRVAGAILVSPAGGVHNQPLARAMRQITKDAVREDPRMASIVLPDYMRFGLMSTFRLFRELTRFPSLERMLRSTVPTLAVIGTRDPLMPPPWRVREVGRLGPDHLTVVVIQGAAHVVNFSHPAELAHVVRSWLDGKEILDDPDAPGVSRVLRLPRSGPDPAVR